MSTSKAHQPNLSLQEIEQLGDLARISIDPGEAESLQADLNRILDYVGQLNEIDTSEVKPMTHVNIEENVFRKDYIVATLDFNDVKEIVPNPEGRHISVPLIIEDK